MAISTTMKNRLPSICESSYFATLLIAIFISLIYGPFLWNPVVFDDIYFFDGSIRGQYLDKIFSLGLRWLPYATFEWTRALFGLDLIWFHLGNNLLHIANAILLFVFLRKLFETVIPDINVLTTAPTSRIITLSSKWTAFFAALIFAMHPAAVYAVTYLSQRSILMATCFVLIMLNLFLRGTIRRNTWYFVASAVAYFFAVLSKEHAIMAPAVALALLLLVCKPDRQLFKDVLPTFFLYGLIAVFIVYQVKTRNILGHAYEINGPDMLSRLNGIDPAWAYPLSILTQSFLFFKYLFVWIVPSPAWMSVDMKEGFAVTFWSWPHTAGLLAFISYPVIAIYLLLKGHKKGLLGFAMLCPWLLFATEFSTVRIQESFVLYRSYLWMIGLFAAAPFLLQKLSAKRAVWVMSAIVILMVPLTWARLTTFTHPLLLWDDAARLIDNKDVSPGVERIYHNRGLQFARLKMYPQAMQDYDKALAVYPDYAYAYNDRGALYFATGEYKKALVDFTKALELDSQYSKPYLGLAKTYEALGDRDAARLNYQKLCAFGVAYGCKNSAL